MAQSRGYALGEKRSNLSLEAWRMLIHRWEGWNPSPPPQTYECVTKLLCLNKLFQKDDIITDISRCVGLIVVPRQRREKKGIRIIIIILEPIQGNLINCFFGDWRPIEMTGMDLSPKLLVEQICLNLPWNKTTCYWKKVNARTLRIDGHVCLSKCKSQRQAHVKDWCLFNLHWK